MQRSSIVAEIFGYLVCLLAVVVFFASVAGVTSNAFRVVHPTPMHARLRPGYGGARFGFGVQPPAAVPLAIPGSPNRDELRQRATAGARFEAVRRLVVALVMLVLSAIVFRRTFAWLNPVRATT
ncbi:MAG TPA: hypothetical protein VFF63_04540 [Candidatus Babeliales bacterium]|nr:hypothetical protein [Candidatus Babeliales bacterium]